MRGFLLLAGIVLAIATVLPAASALDATSFACTRLACVRADAHEGPGLTDVRVCGLPVLGCQFYFVGAGVGEPAYVPVCFYEIYADFQVLLCTQA